MPRQVSGTFPQTRRASSLGQWFGDQSRSPRKNSPISEPGLQIEDAHRGRPLIGRGDVWDRTGFAVSVLGTHSGNPARRSASARVARRSLFEE